MRTIEELRELSWTKNRGVIFAAASVREDIWVPALVRCRQLRISRSALVEALLENWLKDNTTDS